MSCGVSFTGQSCKRSAVISNTIVIRIAKASSTRLVNARCSFCHICHGVSSRCGCHYRAEWQSRLGFARYLFPVSLLDPLIFVLYMPWEWNTQKNIVRKTSTTLLDMVSTILPNSVCLGAQGIWTGRCNIGTAAAAARQPAYYSLSLPCPLRRQILVLAPPSRFCLVPGCVDITQASDCVSPQVWRTLGGRGLYWFVPFIFIY